MIGDALLERFERGRHDRPALFCDERTELFRGPCLFRIVFVRHCSKGPFLERKKSKRGYGSLVYAAGCCTYRALDLIRDAGGNCGGELRLGHAENSSLVRARRG